MVLGKQRVVTAVSSRSCSSSEALKLVGGRCWESQVGWYGWGQLAIGTKGVLCMGDEQ